MSSIEIKTDKAPPAIGPYVQARVAGNTLYTSGIVAIDPKTGNRPSTTEEQTNLVLSNLSGILEASNFNKTDIVKVGLYLLDMGDFELVNGIYAAYFGDHKPCRTCIQAGKLPASFRVELECIAVRA